MPASFPPNPEELARVIRQQAAFVLGARGALVSLKAEVDGAKREWEKQHAVLLDALDSARASLATQEQTLREMAVLLYRQNGDNHPGPGVSIRLQTRTAYDPTQALEWAKSKRIFLLLDTRSFEKFAADCPGEVPFVVVSKEPQATIAVDLSKALEVTHV